MDLSKIKKYEKKIKEFKEVTITDGVCDGKEYFNSKYRIAWFLKEAYTTEENSMHMKDYLAPDPKNLYNNFFKNVSTQTWHPIIYCSYGILNEFATWDDLDYIKNKQEMCEVIKNIAIINANKYPSKTGSHSLWPNVNEGFKKFEKVIKEQIEVLQPEIHIFGGTIHLYKDFFKLNDDFQQDYWVWEKDGKLYLDVFHPANRKQKREEYVNEIVNTVKKWANRKNNKLIKR